MKKKIVSLCLIVALAATAVIGGTLAYFSDQDSATNVFTVGDVDIVIHESNLADYAGTTRNDEVVDDDYREWLTNDVEDRLLMPSQSLPKYVTIENVGPNAAYVRVKVVAHKDLNLTWGAGITATIDGYDVANMTKAEKDVRADENGNLEYLVELSDAVVSKYDAPNNWTADILCSVELDESVDNAIRVDNYTVVVFAEAIQAAGFDSAALAFDALDDELDTANTTQVFNATDLNTSLQQSTTITRLVGDVETDSNIIMADNAAVLDGAGATINKTYGGLGGYNAGVQTAGGTIKNVTIEGVAGDKDTVGDGKLSFRAVFVTNGLANDLVIENTTLNSPSGYALNINGGGNHTLSVKDSTINGWVSYGKITSAEFLNCEFITENANAAPSSEGGDLTLNCIRPYANSVLTDCDFVDPYIFSAGTDGITIELNNCTVGGVPVTAANFASIFVIEAGDAIYDCTVIVDGAPVAF